MKTDELIDLLSTGIGPLDVRNVARNLRIAIVTAMVVALLSCISILGVRPDLDSSEVVVFLLIKCGFGAVVIALGWKPLLGHARPGGENRSPILLAGLPFAAMMAVATVALISAPASEWGNMITDESWIGCLLAIPVMAVAPFGIIVWAIRMAAPTNLVRTGALAGLVAGGISAAAYALHCPADTLPFIALWYGGTIAVCALAGAALGRPVLRW